MTNHEATTESETPLWAIVELMGHIRTGGRISKDNQFGSPLMRLDVPTENDLFVTQFVNPSSIYRVTICEEDIARVAARGNRAEPINRWELMEALGPEFREALQIVDQRKRQQQLEFEAEEYAYEHDPEEDEPTTADLSDDDGSDDPPC